MTAPIPLADPSGTVRAWACAFCGQVDTRRVGAESCCTECHCGSRDSGAPCFACLDDGRDALEALACIGMAVAACLHMQCAWKEGIARERTGRFDEHWRARTAEALAALCGVDVETVRGWS